jgi:glycosyltransferase involved in cell wall biosynthesis
MRILVVTHYFYPENFRINDVCIGLRERGHDVSVLTGKPNYPVGKYFTGYKWFGNYFEDWNGIALYRSNLFSRRNGEPFYLFLNYTSFAFFACFRLLTIRSKFDRILIFAPSPLTVAIPGIIASKWFKAKSILWVHDLWPESVRIAGGIQNSFILGLVDIMIRAIYKRVDLILIQSEYFRSYIQRQVDSKKEILYYPFYAEDFYKVEAPNNQYRNLLPDGFKLIFAGNIGEGQSFPTLIKAADYLNKKGFPITWVIFGDGRMKDAVLNEISRLGLADIFILKGTVPSYEIPKYLSCADGLVVSLKKSEIFSMTIPGKLQSYLACGRPIIASLDGIGAEIVERAECGYIAKSESVEELVKAVLKLFYLTSEERSTLGMNGRAFFEKEFERGSLLDKLEAILSY